MINKAIVLLAVAVIAAITLPVGGCMIGMPYYNRWAYRMEGEAQLAKSEASKKIAIEEAKAKEESAKYESQAEVIRAEGVAKANKVIGESLKNNPDYLRYMFLKNLESGDHDTIYIPTEAMMPIMEAGRFNRPKPIPVPIETDEQP